MLYKEYIHSQHRSSTPGDAKTYLRLKELKLQYGTVYKMSPLHEKCMGTLEVGGITQG
jgi:hypothetical protein